jgi:hypothetical protein
LDGWQTSGCDKLVPHWPWRWTARRNQIPVSLRSTTSQVYQAFWSRGTWVDSSGPVGRLFVGSSVNPTIAASPRSPITQHLRTRPWAHRGPPGAVQVSVGWAVWGLTAVSNDQVIPRLISRSRRGAFTAATLAVWLTLPCPPRTSTG